MQGGFNVLNVALLTAGAILVYSGAKGVTPKELINDLFIKGRAKPVPNIAPKR
jgi:hypothetical protein